MAKSIEYKIMRLRRESPIHIYIDLFHEDTMSSIDMNLKFVNVRKCNYVYAYLEMQLKYGISLYEIFSLYDRVQLGR